jgi:hypothetical protein
VERSVQDRQISYARDGGRLKAGAICLYSTASVVRAYVGGAMNHIPTVQMAMLCSPPSSATYSKAVSKTSSPGPGTCICLAKPHHVAHCLCI